MVRLAPSRSSSLVVSKLSPKPRRTHLLQAHEDLHPSGRLQSKIIIATRQAGTIINLCKHMQYNSSKIYNV